VEAGHKGRRKEGVYVFVSTYENRRMKPAEIVLRREGGGKRQNMMGAGVGGLNPTKIYFKRI
jgi:hypothetical protein